MLAGQPPFSGEHLHPTWSPCSSHSCMAVRLALRAVAASCFSFMHTQPNSVLSFAHGSFRHIVPSLTALTFAHRKFGLVRPICSNSRTAIRARGCFARGFCWFHSKLLLVFASLFSCTQFFTRTAGFASLFCRTQVLFLLFSSGHDLAGIFHRLFAVLLLFRSRFCGIIPLRFCGIIRSVVLRHHKFFLASMLFWRFVLSLWNSLLVIILFLVSSTQTWQK